MTKLPLPALFLALALVLSACSGGQVRDESPLVRINELSLQDDTITLQLRIRNVNDEALDIRQLTFDMTSDKRELIAWNGPVSVNITAQGTETWSADVPANEHSRELLDALQRGDVMSLPYELKGGVETLESKKLRFESKGHLYPLPGKPGYFR